MSTSGDKVVIVIKSIVVLIVLLIVEALWIWIFGMEI